jgi:hypothetical protein
MALSITINTPPPLVVSTTTLAQGYVGAPYSHTLVATGGNGVYSWSTNSTLPTGLTLSAAGVLSGTPTVAATANITVIVADSAGTAPANNILSLTVVVPGPISITTTSLPAGTVGATYSASLVATGGTTAYTWTTTNGTLPGGLALAGNGIISGTPTTAGTFTFGANVTDTAHATLGSNFSITIAAYVPPPVYGGGGGGAPLTYAIALTGLSGSLNVNSSGVSSSGGQLTNGSGLILSAPAGATLLTAQGTYLTTITLASPGTSPPAAPAGKVIIATYQFGPDGATFNPALTLTVPYTPGSLPGGVKETDLVIARWNGTAWTILTTTVDAQAKTVSAPVTGFSYFALLAPQPAPTTAAPTPTSTPPPTTTAAPPTTTAPPPTTTAPPATSTPPSTQTPTSSTPSESTSSESNALLWVILAGSLVVVAVVVGILVSRRRRK